VQVRVDPAALLADGARVAGVDALRDGPDGGQGGGEVELSCRRDGQLVGFVGWFEARLSPSVVLSTAPGDLETHWSQTFLPFTPRFVRAGERLRLSYRLGTHPDEHRHLLLELGLDSTQLSFRLE